MDNVNKTLYIPFGGRFSKSIYGMYEYQKISEYDLFFQ